MGPTSRIPGESRPLARSRASRARVLFVDDEEALMRLGAEQLARMGFEVEAAGDGGEALRLFRSDPDRFALVITDQSMPTRTGLQLAREIQKLRPGVPIILCSGSRPALSAEALAELGVRAVILKPFSAEQLADLARGVLGDAA